MTPLEMIAEWRKGCSVTDTLSPDAHPVDCKDCTIGLIDALEKRLQNTLWQRIVRLVRRNHA